MLVETVYKTKRIETLVPDLTTVEQRFPVMKKAVFHQRGNPIGILVGVKNKDEIRIGWSAFNHKDKRFDRNVGKRIALARTADEPVDVHIQMQETNEEHQNRLRAATLGGFVRYEKETVMTINADDDSPPVKIAKAIDKFQKRCERYFK